MTWKRVPANMKRCAFCSHWADPGCSHVHVINVNVLEFDASAKEICPIYNKFTPKGAEGFCGKFLKKKLL